MRSGKEAQGRSILKEDKVRELKGHQRSKKGKRKKSKDRSTVERKKGLKKNLRFPPKESLSKKAAQMRERGGGPEVRNKKD